MAKYVPKKPIDPIPKQGHLLRDLVTLSLGFFGIIVIAYFVIGYTAEKLATQISYSDEIGFVRSFSKNLPDLKVYDHSKIPKLESLATELYEPYNSEKISIDVGVFDSTSENAFMIAGGFLRVTNKLLDSVTSENELAFIICHELGHFHHRHPLKRLGRGLSVIFALSYLGFNGTDIDLAGKGIQFGELANSRDQETEADEFALECLNKKYGHVNGSTSFFERLQKLESNSNPSQMNPKRYILTHPITYDRIEKLKEWTKTNSYKADGPLINL